MLSFNNEQQGDLERAFDQARERLNLALSAGNLAWWEMDCRTGEVAFNEQKTRMLGYVFEDFAGARYTAFTDLLHPEDHDRVMEAMRKHLSGEKSLYEVEYRIRAKSGNYVWFYDRGSITDRDETGRPLIVKGVVFDITQRKEAELALKRRTGELTAISEILRKKARVLANRNKELLCLYRFSELIETNDASLDAIFNGVATIIPPALRYQEIAYAELNVDGRRFRSSNFADTAWQLRCNLIVRGGTYGYLLIGYLVDKWTAEEKPFLWEERALLHALCERLGRVIERKQAEESLTVYARDLALANKEIESFSYSVSHDLRNPLNAIIAMVEVLDLYYRDRLDVDGKRCISEISKSAGRMSEIIDGLLFLSRLTVHEIEPADIDLSSLTREIIADLRKSQPERHVEIVIEDNLRANADPRLMKIALNNIFENAWKYTGKREKPVIEFGALRERDKTIFYIKDNGAGFDMAFADKIFQPFQRLHADSDFSGTGIGLATVQRIIRRHGGKLWAEGKVDQGATFYFTLPGSDDG